MRDITMIEDESIKGLKNLEKNYMEKNRTEGGVYTLVEVRRELLRRNGGIHNGETVYKAIFALLTTSSSGFITYGELFVKLHNKLWKGNGSQGLITKDLYAAIYYCVQNQLPILTSLVIRKDETQPTSEAMQNIYDCAKQSGIKDMPGSVEKFVLEQQQNSLQLINTI
jgi:hypothetical protein